MDPWDMQMNRWDTIVGRPFLAMQSWTPQGRFGSAMWRARSTAQPWILGRPNLDGTEQSSCPC